MSTDTNNPVSDRRAKLMRHRWLWSVVILCLLLWGFKAVHHAMQPKYQGKTAEEWFAQFDAYANATTQTELHASSTNAVFGAFQHFGPDAARFLWSEYNQKDSSFRTWCIRKAHTWSAGRWRIDSAWVRHFKAGFLLEAMGPKAGCLVPDLRASLKAAASEGEQSKILRLLNKIGPKDLSKLPYLIPGLNSTNAGTRANSLDGLHYMGIQAASALPALEKLLQKSNGFEKLNAAAVMVALGDESKLKLLQAEIQNPNTKLQEVAFLFLAALTEDGVDVVPTLRTIAKDPRSSAATKETANSLIEQITAKTSKTKGPRK